MDDHCYAQSEAADESGFYELEALDDSLFALNESNESVENLEPADDAIDHAKRHRDICNAGAGHPYAWPRGKPLSKDARRMILSAHYHAYQCLPEKERSSEAAATMAATILGVSLTSVKKVIHLGHEADTPGRKRKKAASVSEIDTLAKNAIREKLYNSAAAGETMTIAKLAKSCREDGIFSGSNASMNRIVRNSLDFGFSNPDPTIILQEKPQIQAWKRRFLRQFMKAKRDGYTIVYQDETWVFQNGSQKKRMWHDGTARSMGRRGINTGKRFVICHAGSELGFVQNASLIFPSRTMYLDYHGDMNAVYFMKWVLDDFLPNLPPKCAIIIDNASYHGLLLEKPPVKSRTKTELYQWLEDRGYDIDFSMNKQDLYEHCMRLTPPTKSYVFDTLMAKHGHLVIRNAPYHSKFNAIEQVWAHVKGKFDEFILMVNDKHTTEVVLETWAKAVDTATPDIWAKYTRHAERVIEEEFKNLGLSLDEPERVVVDLSPDSDDSDYSDDSDGPEEEISEEEKERRQEAEQVRLDKLLKQRILEVRNGVLDLLPQRKKRGPAAKRTCS